ncbi:MAG TPA: AMP-binding protein [Candidatus Eisenbacteria bacterium]|nr:AMP-binding protein [Candidatus Eisenbacteria bacterium]
MTEPQDGGPEYFLETFPRDAFPQYRWDTAPPALPEAVWMSETTHRDGQQGGLPLNAERSRRIYDLLCEVTGDSGAIRHAEFFPYRDSDRDALRYAIDRHAGGAPIEPTTWIRARRDDVELVARLGVPETGMLSSASDYHTFHKFKPGGRSRAASMYLEAVQTALDLGIRPRFHLEDTTRAEPDFVRWLVEAVLELGSRYPAELAPRFRLADTLGVGLPFEDVALPRSIPRWIRLMRSLGIEPGAIELHPHNDTGLVVANSLAAIRAGCGVISGCCLGTGERTGNAPLETVMVHLLGMGYWRDRPVDLRPLNELAELYHGLGVGPAAKYPLFGRDAYVTRAGVHADGLNKFWWMYAPFNAPQLVGRELEVAITKDSGQAGLLFVLKQRMGLELRKDDPRVAEVNGWLNDQFAGGRESAVEWTELEPVVRRAFHDGPRCPVVERFERLVDAGGDRPAVLLSGRPAVTYRELDERANAIAHALLDRRGDGPEPVPLHVHDPASMLAAVLGVLKAGKHYVPVNPLHPPARNRSVLEQLRPALVITDGSAPPVETSPEPEWLDLGEAVSRGRRDRPAVPIEPGRFAYVLYTSGSTGAPRGIAQRREDMWHNVLRHQPLAISPDDRVTLISADGFVGAISNVYIALLNGAALAPYSFQRDGVHGMLGWLEATGVTVCYSFPSFLRQVASVAEAGERAGGLRVVYLGGESVHHGDLEAARRLLPGATLAVGLNSTETGLTRLHLVPPDAELPDPVPVGGPVLDVEVAVLDGDREAPPGERGEIATRSRYVRPVRWTEDGLRELTTGVPGAPGVFQYRTGDRGYLDPAGRLFHVGRQDGMVKVRGYRVETAEVESAIAGLPGVAEAAVVPFAASPDETELAAYVVGREPGLEPAAIRRQLEGRLPGASVPTSVLVLDALPRLRNGKVDRRALPAPVPAALQPGPSRLAETDRAGVEGRIAAIWREVLRADRVGSTDSFFALGGTSISAVKVISLVRRQLGVPVRLSVIFETPTIEALAEAVSSLRATAEEG